MLESQLGAAVCSIFAASAISGVASTTDSCPSSSTKSELRLRVKRDFERGQSASSKAKATHANIEQQSIVQTFTASGISLDFQSSGGRCDVGDRKPSASDTFCRREVYATTVLRLVHCSYVTRKAGY